MVSQGPGPPPVWGLQVSAGHPVGSCGRYCPYRSQRPCESPQIGLRSGSFLSYVTFRLMFQFRPASWAQQVFGHPIWEGPVFLVTVVRAPELGHMTLPHRSARCRSAGRADGGGEHTAASTSRSLPQVTQVRAAPELGFGSDPKPVLSPLYATPGTGRKFGFLTFRGGSDSPEQRELWCKRCRLDCLSDSLSLTPLPWQELLWSPPCPRPRCLGLLNRRVPGARELVLTATQLPLVLPSRIPGVVK